MDICAVVADTLDVFKVAAFVLVMKVILPRAGFASFQAASLYLSTTGILNLVQYFYFSIIII